jgi:hypothetical protein
MLRCCGAAVLWQLSLPLSLHIYPSHLSFRSLLPIKFAGWFNEGPSNKAEACPAYGQCNDYARARDPTRFTTWADDKDLGGKCYEHCTLLAFNNYPGWYSRNT